MPGWVAWKSHGDVRVQARTPERLEYLARWMSSSRGRCANKLVARGVERSIARRLRRENVGICMYVCMRVIFYVWMHVSG